MITLRITFLLAINLKEDEKVWKKSKKSKKKSKKRSKSESSGKSSKSNKSKTKTKKTEKSKFSKKSYKRELINKIPEEELNYTVIEVKDPLRYVHVEYELFPKKFKYGVDVVCWGPVAKIYASNRTKSLKTVIKDNIVWIPVFIEHYLNELTTEEIRGFLKQVISFTIKIGKSSTGVQAKKDKSCKFYEFREDADAGDFTEVFTERPLNEDKEIMKQEIARILKKLLTFPIKSEIVSWIHNIHDVHAYKISKIITKRSRGEEVYCKDFDVEKEKTGRSQKKSKKSSSKGGRSKQSKEGSKSSKSSKGKDKLEEKSSVNFKIPSYILLSDPILATYQLKDTGTKISEAYILLSSDNFLTLRQKCELNPLVLKIRKISNLPDNIIKQNGFNGVYSNCNIPGVTEFKTLVKPIADVVRFEESHFICTNDLPRIKILEILQTRSAIIELFGVKESSTEQRSETGNNKKIEKKKKEKKKSSTKSSKKFSKSNKSDKSGAVLQTGTESVMLAVARFDLSSLAKNFFLLKEKKQCYNLQSIFIKYPPNFDHYFLDRFTVNEINLALYPNRRNSSPLSDDVLILNNTTLKFEAHFLIPQYPLFHFRDVTSTYKRFLLIIFDEEIAKVLVKTIMQYNIDIVGSSALLIPNILIKKVYEDSENILSGFFIDDGNCFIFFVEGLSNGFILNLLHQISGYNYPAVKVFYNSDFLFENRLYFTFFNHVGFFLLNLKMPLYDIFNTQEVFLEGNVPMPCFKAIQKLHLILNSTSFRSILNYDLLPTEFELASFAVEFSLYMQHKSKKSLEKDNSEDNLVKQMSAILSCNTDFYTK